MATSHINIQNGQIYLSDQGLGDPILFLHGVPDSADMWNGIIPLLEDHYRCIAIDLPGLGRSTAQQQFDCSLDNMALFIENVIESYHLPTPLNLVVTDFGATYGLSWAITYPNKVRRIAIVGGANFSASYRWHINARLLRIPLLGELGMATQNEAAFEKMMHQNAPLLSTEHLHQTYALTMAKPEARRMILKLYRSISPKDFVDREERLATLTETVPTLVLWGDKDPFITPEYAHRFGSAQVKHFPDNGHWLAVEAPAVVAECLKTFLA